METTKLSWLPRIPRNWGCFTLTAESTAALEPMIAVGGGRRESKGGSARGAGGQSFLVLVRSGSQPEGRPNSKFSKPGNGTQHVPGFCAERVSQRRWKRTSWRDGAGKDPGEQSVFMAFSNGGK